MQRSNTATRLRKVAAAIFGVNALDMSPSITRQEKFHNMILDYESTWPRNLFHIEGQNPSQGLQRCVRQTEGIFEYKVDGGVYLIPNSSLEFGAHLLF